MTEAKVCSQCGAEKLVTEFYRQKGGKHGRAGQCKACAGSYKRRWVAANHQRERENGRRWAEQNPERKKALNREWHVANPERRRHLSRRARLLRAYGITLEDHDHLMTLQVSGCAICGYSPEPGRRPLAVDHDHTTGAVRGLLCDSCNLGLGKFGEDQRLLQQAALYLHHEPRGRG